jgi:drug/metabolite transporter (DMT)-like permease
MGLTQFLQPVAGLVLAVLLVGETVGAPEVLAGAAILLGTALARGGAR